MSIRTVERVVDLPRAIVWDGLVDPVLVEGWFDPELRLVGGEPRVEVLERRDPELLRVRIAGLGELTFSSDEVAGGTRGTSTLLRFTGPVGDPDELLDRLEDLLRGHPVDWRAEAPAIRSAG
ncbi:hypothetical protein GCM10009840_25840 [Pseudolysinimonas kribbensis]|uniref:SRPBCC domain-containing protein n=1 Tax=Pseudolysinimonas kribbensis TaxID=433641 RepID=A0ABQ6KBH2_9MICO|nr:hypothetical protein [Pseudolysinimonas kribbensis]GMA96624.1 hypothetical protein GCM10025881_34480 [Pseudolysinimonas kribbensis]